MPTNPRRRIEEAAREIEQPFGYTIVYGHHLKIVAVLERLIREAAEVVTRPCYDDTDPDLAILSHFGLGEEEGRERNG
ncbi:hypothetical protein [Longimicrobium sp.]|uniref:hypothetical protein n=1 Tax=Longimicrobium sp. TaxID=2029185 RepID=UPI002E35BA13|nr:hypothetical protein [Longimicrobium sp.]HEX6038893.1 hypothetical protein [Longimicrobium sp.]